ncbi:MAG: UDP-2,3-diacylglucosamine diphosphatase [candidate division WOR-3 bacterium]
MSAHYFVSDAHIGAQPGRSEARLLSFLKTIRNEAESVYLLGDLFEFWLEYRHAVPRHGFSLLSVLAEMHRQGTSISYLKGNHDFGLGEFLSRELGAVVADELDLTIDGRRVYLAHGDALDHGLVPRLFRGLMRSRVNRALYSLLHPDLGISLAHRIALASRDLGAKPYLQEAMARFAQDKLARGFDIVILGHSHLPEIRRLGSGVYVNIGDWVQSFTYGRIMGGNVSLERFED